MDVAVLLRLLGMLAVLLVGTGLRAGGVLTDNRTARLNAAAYYLDTARESRSSREGRVFRRSVGTED